MTWMHIVLFFVMWGITFAIFKATYDVFIRMDDYNEELTVLACVSMAWIIFLPLAIIGFLTWLLYIGLVKFLEFTHCLILRKRKYDDEV